MRKDSKPFTVNIAFDSEIFQDGPTEYIKFLKYLPENTPIFLSNNYFKILHQIDSSTHHEFIPVFSTLRNNSKSSEDAGLSQIDAIGNVISQYSCPNNPKVENFVKSEFNSINKYQRIAGIQLGGLEMPSLRSTYGCFCPFCHSVAEGQGIKLKDISHELKQIKAHALDEKLVSEKFPYWTRFRMQSITNFAGKLMILLRQINPDLFLGLNLNFSETPELFGQDYFFLALYLDLLNFIIDSSNLQEKDILHQIKIIKRISKKFLGSIKVFLQFLLPDSFQLDDIKMILQNTQHDSFDGVVFRISSLDGLKKWGEMAPI